MGNTIAQLLAAMGMGSGMGGNGGMGGYGMVGLYGGLPDMFGQGGRVRRRPRGRRPPGGGANGRSRTARIPTRRSRDELFAPGAAGGAGEGAVPVRYRRQVGQYFQRVAEETEESGQ